MKGPEETKYKNRFKYVGIFFFIVSCGFNVLAEKIWAFKAHRENRGLLWKIQLIFIFVVIIFEDRFIFKAVFTC